MNRIIILLIFIIFLISCNSGNNSDAPFEIIISEDCDGINYNIFGDEERLNEIISPPLTELSGLAAAINNPGYYWTHNDSGNPPYVFLLDSLGSLVATFRLNTSNIDWEDIACVTSPYDNKSYLFVADFGDNSAIRTNTRILKFAEPVLNQDMINYITVIDSFEEQFIEYPDGPKDAETLIVDPLNLDYYIISKREANSRVFTAEYPQPEHNLLEHIATLPFGFAVAGDISNTADEILVKTLLKVYYWERKKNEELKYTFSRQPICLPYNPEPKGEAICFAYNGAGYYTVSEVKDFENYGVTFNFYPRL